MHRDSVSYSLFIRSVLQATAGNRAQWQDRLSRRLPEQSDGITDLPAPVQSADGGDGFKVCPFDGDGTQSLLPSTHCDLYAHHSLTRISRQLISTGGSKTRVGSDPRLFRRTGAGNPQLPLLIGGNMSTSAATDWSKCMHSSRPCKISASVQLSSPPGLGLRASVWNFLRVAYQLWPHRAALR
jgi:hypothetical protein